MSKRKLRKQIKRLKRRVAKLEWLTAPPSDRRWIPAGGRQQPVINEWRPPVNTIDTVHPSEGA